MKLKQQITFWYVIAAVMAVLLIRDLLVQPDHTRVIPYSEFQALAEEGKVTDLVIGANRITGALKDQPDGKVQHFSTIRVPADLAQSLDRSKVKFTGEPEPGLLQNLLVWLLPSLSFFLIWMFLIRRISMGQGGLMAIGKSKAKVYVEKDTKVTFADVAGVDEAKDELQEIVEFLKDPEARGHLGARMPKGVLLVGPPGTGKTLLARAVAGEAGVPFFSISGSEFVEMFVGVGAARVRDLFEQAREQAPAIVFVDELDALGRARASLMPGGGHDEKEQTLNQLLSEMDGFDPSSGIVLLAATNRPEILDPALLRAGRFDRQVLVDRPDRKGRTDILKVHVRKVKLGPEVNVEDLAALTPGFTGADLANLVNEAALLATRKSAESVSFNNFVEAIERIVAGLEKRNRLLNPHEREIVAHHEIGHAMVAMALPGTDPIQKVSIIPRGVAALGYTMQRPIDDRFLMDRAELMDRMTVLLGGRAAESIAFPEVSTGAADDLNKATEIARSMVARFGMVKDLGQVAYEPEVSTFLAAPGQSAWQPRRYAEATAAAIDEAVKDLIDAAFRRASAILEQNRELFERSATELLEKETLTEEQLNAIRCAVVASPPAGNAGPAPADRHPAAAVAGVGA